MRPRFWDAHEDLARLAVWLRDQRIARYPAAIAKGAITREEAQADILAWSAIAADWQFFVTLQPRTAPDAPLEAKLAAIRTAIERYETRVAASPETPVLQDTLDCIGALYWHAENGRFLSAAAFNAEHRAARQLSEAA